ncbi:hypothetical protein [Spongiibacter marinus]|uniref:hypothetical protein n=1 Tax=Spongiibacter marinus TaxID=354246 RepID=UPI00195F814C|nr:hypothetical protein [Spongiibacter marinus]MBM7422882.1 hypothetical protein [Spongiibacter marinus]
MGIELVNRPRLFIAMLLLWPILASNSSAASTTDLPVTLIAHESVNLDKLNTSTLRAIFSLRKRSWENQTPIKVFVLPDNHPLHKHFCKTVLKIYPYVLRDQWDRVIFSGVGTPPTIVKDIEELRRTVRSTPGAIGYAPAEISVSIQQYYATTPTGL